MLGALAALGPFFAVSAHPPGVPPLAPWRPVSELTGPSAAFRSRVESVRAALAARGGVPAGDIEPRIAVSAVHLGMTARFIAPALGAAVLGRPLDTHPGGLWWQDEAVGAVPLSVPLAAGGGSAPPPGEWDQMLVDELIAPVTTAVARLGSVSGRVLRGNVASAVNAAAGQLATRRPDLAAAAWQAAGRLFASSMLREERHPPGRGFRRSSCCLFYRLAPGVSGAVCGDCVLLGRRGRR